MSFDHPYLSYDQGFWPNSEQESCENCPSSAKIVFIGPFTDIQKSVITWYLIKVESLIKTRAPRLMTNTPYTWVIQGKTDGSCKDEPDAIPINERTMQLLIEGNKFQNSNIISSAFHYFFKAYLRNYLRKNKTQEELNKIYKNYWGYDYKPIKCPSNNVKMGYIVSLKFHGNTRDYHPVLTNSPKGFKPTLIELISRGDECYEMTKVIRAIDSAECLLSRFNGLYAPITGSASSYSNGIDLNEIVDPNRIFVTLISEYVVSNYRFIGNNPATSDIYNVIDNLIGNDCLSNLGQKAYPLS